MKQILVENMLTGFTTERAARITADRLHTAPGVLTAEYHDTRFGAHGHCVRLVIVQADPSAALAYHRVQVAALIKAHKYAVDMEQNEWEAGNRSAADSWHEIAQGLDSALHYHAQFVTDLEVVS